MLTIDGYIIDAEIRAEPTRENVVAQYPVEAGEDHSDHAYKLPLSFVVEGVVSDTPIGAVAVTRQQFTLINGQAFARPSDEARAKLVSLYDSREPIKIVSSSGTYENMVLERLDMPRTAQTGRATRFTATFKQVTFVTNERSSVRVELPRAKGRKNLGFKAAIEAVAQPFVFAGGAATKFVSSQVLSGTPPAPPSQVTENATNLALPRPTRLGF